MPTSSSAPAHTPGPWRIHENAVSIDVVDMAHSNGIAIIELRGVNDDRKKANARRIVACVNACEGIPTEVLEADLIEQLINAAGALTVLPKNKTSRQRVQDLVRKLRSGCRIMPTPSTITPDDASDTKDLRDDKLAEDLRHEVKDDSDSPC